MNTVWSHDVDEVLGTHRCAVTPRMCARRVWISITKNTCMRLRNTVSTCRKSHARIPAAWEARNCRQVGDARHGAGVSPAAARIRRMVPAPMRYPRPRSSPWMRRCPYHGLPGQSLDQLTDLFRDRRASAGVRVGPCVLDQAPVPGGQGAGCHNPVQPQTPEEKPRQRGDHRTIGPVRFRAGDLVAQDRGLMAQYRDLHVFAGVAAGEQCQPAEQSGHQQVEDAEDHECRG